MTADRAPFDRPRPWRDLYPAGLDDLDPVQPLLLERLATNSVDAPSAPAIHYFGTTITWSELAALASGFAASLTERGLASSRVALYLQNVPHFVIATLGTWQTGGTVVPVNPMLKRQEIEHILGDSAARVLVALEELLTDPVRAAAEACGVELIVRCGAREFSRSHTHASWLPDAQPIADSFTLFCRPTDGFAASALDRDTPAFITYTSGTTGRPKGAVNTHANVAFNSAAKAAWFDLGRSDGILCVAPLFHITGLIAHLGLSVATGAPLVLGYRFEPGVMLRLVEDYRPTFAIGAITAYIALLDHPDLATADLSSLTKVYSGGAPVSPAVVARFQREVGPYIHNAYGLTEATAASHLVPFGLPAPVDPNSGALSIGVPYLNTDVRVLDDNGNEVPAGELGELVISGPQIAAGYWGLPDASAATFTPAGLRTGDIGFMDAQGWFYLVDRRKDMIIASGYKVWPREVEDVLYQHPAVREAAVVGVPDDYRGENVKACVSLLTGRTADPTEIIEFCRQRLANYKSPRLVEILDELPKTASGKILRRSLRDAEMP